LIDKWLYINEETAHKKIIRCTKITKLKNLGKFLNNLKCKQKNEVKKSARFRGSARGRILQREILLYRET
jgi:hypothetical protein